MGQDSSQTGQADYYLAQVSSASLYYPFGWEMPGRKFVSGEGYRFGFNGKETDEDATSGSYDFGARMYNSQLGRWWSVDPLAGKNTHASPYEGMGGNPMIYIDPDGKDNIFYIVFIDKGGELNLDLATKNAIIDRVQEMYENNGIHNVKVVGMTESRAFLLSELELLDDTDRIGYLARGDDIINLPEFAGGNAKPGWTETKELLNGRTTEVGYFNLSKPIGSITPEGLVELGLSGSNVSKEIQALQKKYRQDTKSVFSKSKVVF